MADDLTTASIKEMQRLRAERDALLREVHALADDLRAETTTVERLTKALKRIAQPAINDKTVTRLHRIARAALSEGDAERCTFPTCAFPDNPRYNHIDHDWSLAVDPAERDAAPLGTCDRWVPHPQGPHTSNPMCVNWRPLADVEGEEP